MSEIIDPEVIANATRVSAAGTELYIVDHEQRLKALAAGEVSDLRLDYASYDSQNVALKNSEFTVRQASEAGETIWHYSGTMGFDKNAGVGEDNFFEALKSLADQSPDFRVESLYFSNLRLMVCKELGMYAAVNFFSETGRVTYHSSYAGNGRSKPIRVELLPMVNEKIGTDRRDEQFLAHVRGYLLALNSLARVATNRQTAFTTCISTGEGCKHYHDESGNADDQYDKQSLGDATGHLEAEQPRRCVTLDDIGGNEEIKKDMRLIITSYTKPELMKKWGVRRPRGVMLYGPPGTGKSMFAEAVASEIGGKTWYIDSADIYDKWIGNSQKNIKAIFDEAEKRTEPTVMVWNEFEGLISNPKRNEGSGDSTLTSVMSDFKKRSERLGEINPNIIMFAMTNNIDDINDAILRSGRFDVKHYVAPPNDSARMEIMAIKLSEAINSLTTADFTPFADDINIPSLVSATDGMTGADVEELLRRAQFEKAMQETVSTDTENLRITTADLLRHINGMRQS
jgi:SpoVK/Ycf46/Vps4 family AAA+-type ATPase